MIFFAGLQIRGLTRKVVLAEQDRLKIIVTLNAELIVKANRNSRFREIVNSNVATLDGQVSYALAKILYWKTRIEKISGSDLIYDFCHLAREKGMKLFVLGGYPESNLKTVNRLRCEYGIEVRGYSPPHRPYPFDKDHNDEILRQIKAFRPQVIFVGFGAVKQECWIDDNKAFLDGIGVRFAIGSGGTFEFVSGQFSRAPRTVQLFGFEGFWRLLAEPRWFRVKRLFACLFLFRYVLINFPRGFRTLLKPKNHEFPANSRRPCPGRGRQEAEVKQ